MCLRREETEASDDLEAVDDHAVAEELEAVGKGLKAAACFNHSHEAHTSVGHCLGTAYALGKYLQLVCRLVLLSS